MLPFDSQGIGRAPCLATIGFAFSRSSARWLRLRSSQPGSRSATIPANGCGPRQNGAESVQPPRIVGDPCDTHMPGLVRSTDGGATWSDPVQLTATVPNTRMSGAITDIKVDPANSAVVLATTDVGLFRSADAGASWQQVPLIGPVSG